MMCLPKMHFRKTRENVLPELLRGQGKGSKTAQRQSSDFRTPLDARRIRLGDRWSGVTGSLLSPRSAL
jgi:hypothetical protein